MALDKFKQVQDDKVLDSKNKAEHGLAKFAHLNKVVDFVNVKAYADNAAAVAAGLKVGDLYHTAGDVKVVTA